MSQFKGSAHKGGSGYNSGYRATGVNRTSGGGETMSSLWMVAIIGIILIVVGMAAYPFIAGMLSALTNF